MTVMATRNDAITEIGGRDDDVLESLAALQRALEENANEERLLATRIGEMMAARARGNDWVDVLKDEEYPGTVHLVSSTLARLSTASGQVRRSLVVALRSEGVTIPVIARLFGVTHQRVSNLLRRGPNT
jgi:hypothetical protein